MSAQDRFLKILSENSNKIVFIATHYDDFPLTLGGIALWLKGGWNATSLTVCTLSQYVSPEYQKSHSHIPALTGGVKDISENRIDYVTVKRQEEDQRCLAQLDVQWKYLNFLEAPLRGYGLAAHEMTYPAAEPGWILKEREFIQKLTETLIPYMNQGLIIAPLGIGNHIDHRVVNLAAINAAISTKKRLFFAEDLPYAGVPEEQWGDANLIIKNCGYFDIPIGLEKKLALIEHYPSQVEPFYTEGVRKRALQIGQGRPKERIYYVEISQLENIKESLLQT